MCVEDLILCPTCVQGRRRTIEGRRRRGCISGMGERVSGSVVFSVRGREEEVVMGVKGSFECSSW